VNFNRRHKRVGHLFQNRYKSIICEAEPYLPRADPVIHLNPPGKIVPNLAALRRYPMDRMPRSWAGRTGTGRTPPRCWPTSGGRGGAPPALPRRSCRRGSPGRRPTSWAAGSSGASEAVAGPPRCAQGAPGRRGLRGSSERGVHRAPVGGGARHEKEDVTVVAEGCGLATLARQVIAGEGVTDRELRSGAGGGGRASQATVLPWCRAGYGIFGSRSGTVPGGDDLVVNRWLRRRSSRGPTIHQSALEPTSPLPRKVVDLATLPASVIAGNASRTGSCGPGAGGRRARASQATVLPGGRAGMGYSEQEWHGSWGDDSSV